MLTLTPDCELWPWLRLRLGASDMVRPVKSKSLDEVEPEGNGIEEKEV